MGKAAGRELKADRFQDCERWRVSEHTQPHPRGANWLILVAALTVLSMTAARPAYAHGEEGETEPIDLVEQALAIVVNNPDSMGEAIEKLEAVLEADPAEIEELDMEAVARALAGVEAGDAHVAEDALIEALGQDPHPEEAVEEPGGVLGGADATQAPTTEATVTPTTGTTETPTSEPEDEGGVGETMGSGDAEDGLLSTPVVTHGLTERLEGGLRPPGVAALSLAVILAGVGTWLLRRRESGS